MNVTPAQAEKLLTSSLSFKQLGFSMMLTRQKNLYAKDPSQETLLHCTAEINAFLSKFKAVMSADYSIISNL